MASEHNLTIEQGAAFIERYAWSLDGERQDFEGWVPHAQIRTGPGGDLLLELDDYFTVDDNVVVDGEAGKALRLMIPASATRELERSGAWDLFIEQPEAGGGVRLLYGKVDLIKAVSQ